jgi:tetratricopeptide (TPR) repeat protein/transcriptional regulator with XRE-family HTH domain
MTTDGASATDGPKIGRPTGKAARAALRAELAALDVPISGIAAELRARFGLRPRQAWRLAHGWSQDDAAREYNTRHRTTTMSRERLSNYETWPAGGRRASPSTLGRLAELYGAVPAELCDLADLKAMPEADRRLLTAPRPAGDLTVTVSSRSVEPRPARPSRDGRGLEAEFIMAASHESFDHAASAEQTNVGEHQLDQLHEEVYRIASRSGTTDVLTTYQDLYQLREVVYTLLDGQQRPAQRADLLLIAGQVVGLMGHASEDLGYSDAAIEQARAAFMYGEMIGHPGLCAWACAELGIAYAGSDQVAKALLHIRRGLGIAPSALARARLHSLEAAYSARSGHITAARNALTAAAEDMESAEPTGSLFDTSSAGPFGFNHSRRMQVAATTHVRIGDSRAAITAAQQALDLGGDERLALGSAAIARVSIAIAHASERNLDGAQEALCDVLTLPQPRRIAPLNKKLKHLRALLARTYPDDRAARDLSEALEDFTRAPATRFLPQ